MSRFDYQFDRTARSHDSYIREPEDEVDTLVPDSDPRKSRGVVSKEVRVCPNCRALTNCVVCFECGEDTLSIEAAVTPPATPPVASLADRHWKAKEEVRALKAELANCPHQWVEKKPGIAVHTCNLGESIGSSNVWVLRQHRDCPLCGTHEQRTKYEPDWDWSDWE